MVARLSTMANMQSFKRYIGRSGEKSVEWMAVDIYLNVSKNTPPFTLYLQHYLPWKAFVAETNMLSPESVGSVYMVSNSWTNMDVTIGIIISTIESFVTSNGICFVSVLLFTGDLAVSTLTMLSIVLVVICLLGTLLGPLFNYTFGAIEAVGVTVFVGMSVDYALHVAHGYHCSRGQTRFEKVRDTLTHLGVSILGGALTTGGSAIFLLFCKIFFFLQLGTMMLLNTGLALIFSLGWLCAILMIMGPTSNMFSLHFYVKIPCLLCARVGTYCTRCKKQPVLPRNSPTNHANTTPIQNPTHEVDEESSDDSSDDEYGPVTIIDPNKDFI